MDEPPAGLEVANDDAPPQAKASPQTQTMASLVDLAQDVISALVGAFHEDGYVSAADCAEMIREACARVLLRDGRPTREIAAALQLADSLHPEPERRWTPTVVDGGRPG